MDIINDVGSLFTLIGTLIVLFTFGKNFKALTKVQKFGVVILALGVLVPNAIDFNAGFMSSIIM